MQKKFRAVDIDSNEFVYGYFLKDNDNPVIDDGESFVEVYPHTVKQLVGYDKNGTELYEDDIVVSPDGTEYRVFLRMDYELSLKDKISSQFIKKVEE